jgi:hypothetical protein
MKIGTLAWLMGASFVVAGVGGGIAACSSSTTTPVAAEDSGAPPVDAYVAPVDGGSGMDCGSTPSPHPSMGGSMSLYCPFGPDDAGKGSGPPIKCDSPTQHCCLGGSIGGGEFAPSECAATGSACSNGGTSEAGATDIPCEVPQDCAMAGMACCAIGGSPTLVAGCGYYQERGLSGTTCAASCGAGQFQLCGTNTDCPMGMTCTGFKSKGMQLGFCM